MKTLLSCGLAIAISLAASSVSADIAFNLLDNNPGSDGTNDDAFVGLIAGNVARTITGLDSSTVTVDYALTGLDFTAHGGTANETVNFQIAFEAISSDTSGTPLVIGRANQHLGVRSASQSAGTNDDIRNNNGITEALSITTSFNTTYAGPSTFNYNGFTRVRLQGLANTEAFSLNGGAGTTGGNAALDPLIEGLENFTIGTAAGAPASRFAFQDFTVSFLIEGEKVPEPGTAGLLALAGLGTLVRRKRS